jgi:small redox-active disulfide protein 2
MKVQVLGVGCAKCTKLYGEAEKAIAEAGVEAELEKVEGLDEIASFGVAMTPGLVIDGEVKSVGKIPKASKIAKWLEAAKK